ncbi:MAG: YggS family pyridoxal phosphate-dependent enzyme [Actinomycetota bacterium]|nr:YggS family pyridoxal phosphate-dependent enzyme [Actinomycetota bacterium]
MTAPVVAERLAEVRGRIEAAGGAPERVRVVAVTKGFGADAVQAALAAGVTDLGESYADELVAKSTAATGGAPRWRWHFLGRVQRNKVRRVAGVVHLWHAVDRVAAGREIAVRAPGARVLVQVNVSGEERKHGCGFDEAPALVDDLRGLGLDVRGLMAVGPTGPPELARPGYRRLAGLASALGLGERSMGMTDDLEVAVEEGSTIVRVGRALFGTRTGENQLRR